MEIKRIVNGKSHTFTLTDNERNQAMAEIIREGASQLIPSILTKALINRAPDKDIEGYFGTSLEVQLNKDYQENFLLDKIIERTDLMSAMTAAANSAVDDHLDYLVMAKENLTHDCLFHDRCVETDTNCMAYECGDPDELSYRMARACIADTTRAIMFEDIHANPDDQDAAKKDFKEKYGHSISKLLNPEKPTYILNYAAELAMVASKADYMPLDLRTAASIAIGLVPAIENDGLENCYDLRHSVMDALFYLAGVATINGADIEDVCKDLYGASLCDLLNPASDKFIAARTEETEADPEPIIAYRNQLFEAITNKDSEFYEGAEAMINPCKCAGMPCECMGFEELINMLTENNDEDDESEEDTENDGEDEEFQTLMDEPMTPEQMSMYPETEDSSDNTKA